MKSFIHIVILQLSYLLRRQFYIILPHLFQSQIPMKLRLLNSIFYFDPQYISQFSLRLEFYCQLMIRQQHCEWNIRMTHNNPTRFYTKYINYTIYNFALNIYDPAGVKIKFKIDFFLILFSQFFPILIQLSLFLNLQIFGFFIDSKTINQKLNFFRHLYIGLSDYLIGFKLRKLILNIDHSQHRQLQGNLFVFNLMYYYCFLLFSQIALLLWRLNYFYLILCFMMNPRQLLLLKLIQSQIELHLLNSNRYRSFNTSLISLSFYSIYSSSSFNQGWQQSSFIIFLSCDSRQADSSSKSAILLRISLLLNIIYIMNPNKIIENIKQQSKRLVSQLEELQELKAQLTLQEYNDMKKSTLEDLQTFQKSLLGFESGELSLNSEIEKSKMEIMKAIKKNFNQEDIKKNFTEAEIVSIRQKIKNIENSYQVKKIDLKTYNTLKNAAITQIKELGGELTVSEKQFNNLKHQFQEDKTQGINSKKESEYLGIASKEIKDKLNK